MTEKVSDMYVRHAQPMWSSERMHRVMSIASSEYVSPLKDFSRAVITRYNEALIKAKDMLADIQSREEYQQLKEYTLTWVQHVSLIQFIMMECDLSNILISNI